MTEPTQHDRPFDTLPHFRFTACRDGDINFDVVDGTESISIYADCVWDPFPGIMRWLETMTTDAPHCRVEWDACGPDFELAYSRILPDRGAISAAKVDSGHPFAFQAPRRDIVEGFYRSLMAFIASPAFDLVQWHSITLHECLQRILGVTTIDDDILYRLAAWPQRSTEWLLDAAVAAAWAAFPEQACATIRRVLQTDRLTYAEMASTSHNWDLPEDYASSSQVQRHPILREILQTGTINGWDGTDLRLLRSDMIESWLHMSSAITTRSQPMAAMSSALDLANW